MMETVRLHSLKPISSDHVLRNLSLYEMDLLLFALEQWGEEKVWDYDGINGQKCQAYIINHGNHKTAFLTGLN